MTHSKWLHPLVRGILVVCATTITVVVLLREFQLSRGLGSDGKQV